MLRRSRAFLCTLQQQPHHKQRASDSMQAPTSFSAPEAQATAWAGGLRGAGHARRAAGPVRPEQAQGGAQGGAAGAQAAADAGAAAGRLEQTAGAGHVACEGQPCAVCEVHLVSSFATARVQASKHRANSLCASIRQPGSVCCASVASVSQPQPSAGNLQHMKHCLAGPASQSCQATTEGPDRACKRQRNASARRDRSCRGAQTQGE